MTRIGVLLLALTAIALVLVRQHGLGLEVVRTASPGARRHRRARHRHGAHPQPRVDRRPRSSWPRSRSTTPSATGRGSSSPRCDPERCRRSSTPCARTPAASTASARWRCGCATPSASACGPRRSAVTPSSSSSPRVVPLPERPVARQRHRLRGLGAAHGRAARRGRPDGAGVPRRRRPAAHPLAGVRAHRRAHGASGGPAGEAPGGRHPRQQGRRTRRVGPQQLARVVRHDGRLASPPTSAPRGMPCTSSPRTRAPTPARTTTSPHDAGLDTLARVTPGPDDGLRAVLHAASALTSQGGLVVYVGGPLADDDARTLAALRQPGSAGAAMVVDPAAFAGRVAVGRPRLRALRRRRPRPCSRPGGRPPSSTPGPDRPRRGPPSSGSVMVGAR